MQIILPRNTIYIEDTKKGTVREFEEKDAHGFAYYFAEHDQHKPLGRVKIIRGDRKMDLGFIKLDKANIEMYRGAPEFTMSEFKEAVTDYEQISDQQISTTPEVIWPCRFNGVYYALIINRRWENRASQSDY